MSRLPPTSVTACCSALYGHPFARYLMGDSAHPGGLVLTADLARRARIEKRDRVLDLGSGRGASSVHVAEMFGCEVVGVTLEPDGANAATELAARRGVGSRVSFVSGDALGMLSELGAFDVVLMECVLSTLPDKEAALSAVRNSLESGGRLALSDVTLEGKAPAALDGAVGASLCVGDARSLADYVALVTGSGLAAGEVSTHVAEVSTFIKQIGLRLMLARVAVGLKKFEIDEALFSETERVFAIASELVRSGRLGYVSLVAIRS